MKCVQCGSTEKSGKYFYVCGNCGSQFCNSCGSKGKQCAKCRKGYMK